MFYERLTKHMLKNFSKSADSIIKIDEKHKLKSIRFNQMKKIFFIFFLFLYFSNLNAEINFNYYLNKAIENNLQLNAERKNLESAKQSKNISRSEFLPRITISGDQTSTTSTNQVNKSGTSLVDSNLDSESKTITLEQKIFSGFKGINTFKKTELETQKANLELKQTKQQTRQQTIQKHKPPNNNNKPLNLLFLLNP